MASKHHYGISGITAKAVLTLSLALTSAPELIKRFTTSGLFLKAATYKGVHPFYKPWMRFPNNNNNHNIITISYMKARIARIGQ